MESSVMRSVEDTIRMCDTGSTIVKLILLFVTLVAMSIGMQFLHEFLI
jgi:hypothetical protein